MKPVLLFLIFLSASSVVFTQQDRDKIFLEKIETIVTLDSLSMIWNKLYLQRKSAGNLNYYYADSISLVPYKKTYFQGKRDSLKKFIAMTVDKMKAEEAAILKLADSKTDTGKMLIEFSLYLKSAIPDFLSTKDYKDKTIDKEFFPPPPPAPVPVGTSPMPGVPAKEAAKEGVTAGEADKPGSDAELSDEETGAPKVDLFSKDMKMAAEFLKTEKNLQLSDYELDKKDLKLFSPLQKEFILCTIFALKGKKFAEEEVSQFFSLKKWYKPVHDTVYQYLGFSERKNLRTLKHETGVELKYWK